MMCWLQRRKSTEEDAAVEAALEAAPPHDEDDRVYLFLREESCGSLSHRLSWAYSTVVALSEGG